MDNFIQAFADGLEQDSQGETKDESPASRVNVVLRSARRFVRQPDQERPHFEQEVRAFHEGIESAIHSLEQLHEQAGEAEEVLIEFAHQELENLQDEAGALNELLTQANEPDLDRICQRLLLPTYRLLLAQDALNRLSEIRDCPYCETDNPRGAERCSGCGKPLSVPDPLTQEGELFPVTPAISQLLELCFQVSTNRDASLETWKNHLHQMKSTFGEALKRVDRALSQEKPGPTREEFQQMKHGLDVMLDGFNELASFEANRNPEILDTGWVNMMSGFKVFKLAGDRLSALASEQK
jgi:hypothetical protein